MKEQGTASHCKVSGLYPECRREPQKGFQQETSMFRILNLWIGVGEGKVRGRRR